jgi:hypothetical protein
MKPDLYTKAVLTVIALVLVAILCNQYIRPTVIAQAEGALSGLQFSSGTSSFMFFDSHTGDVYAYNKWGILDQHLRLAKLGEPLQAPYLAP